MTNGRYTMMNSPNTMPGAFNFHQDSSGRVTAAPPRLSGAKSHLFQPPASTPRTPGASASSSLILTRSTTSMASIQHTSNSAMTRKRTLHDYNDSREEEWAPTSPAPFVNTRYHLAGGMDTPSLVSALRDDQEIGGSEYSDLKYRKSLSNGNDGHTLDVTRKLFAEHEGGLAHRQDSFGLEREANGRPRSYGYYGENFTENTNGWSKGAVRVVGAVVGKAWEFCKIGATVFTGFRAGGGTGYKMDDMNSVAHFEAVDNENNWESEKLDGEWRREGTPIPGRFPEDTDGGLEFIPDYMDNPTPDGSLVRPAKRRQTSNTYSNDELAKNWVVINNQSTPTTAAIVKPQPRPQPRYLIPTASATRRSVAVGSLRPISRAGFTPSLTPRRPMLSRGSHAGSPALQASRGASYASPRSPASTPRSQIPRASQSPMREVKRENSAKGAEDSPAAKEAKKWKQMKRKEEKEADESMRRLDAQLKAMIREGKEALGTKVEVEDGDDEDFVPSVNTGHKRWAF